MTRRRLDDDEIEEIREIFVHFDRDSSGTIDRGELRQLLEAMEAECSDEELETGLKEIDSNQNGRIEFREFLRWWSDR